MKVKYFDDYEDDVVGKMNKFIQSKDVVEIKMNTVVAITGKFFNAYLVMYNEEKVKV